MFPSLAHLVLLLIPLEMFMLPMHPIVVFQKFPRSGNFITKWGSYGNGIVNFISHGALLLIPRTIFMLVMYLIVALRSLTVTVHLLPNGDLVASMRDNSSYRYGKLVDSSCRVFMLPIRKISAFKKFDSSGTFITKWGLCRQR